MANPAIEAYAVKQREFQTRQNTAIEGITGDAERSAALIKKLQDSPDGWTPADQAALDELTTLSESTTTKLEALDALTAPAIPEVPPTEPNNQQASGRR